jgi:hypothetical protein
LIFRYPKPYASSSKNAAFPAAEDTENNLEEDGCHLTKEETYLQDGSEDDMKEETEDVFVAGESPPLKNEESSGPLRSRTPKSRELRSRPVLESAKSDTDQGAEDLPLEKVN